MRLRPRDNNGLPPNVFYSAWLVPCFFTLLPIGLSLSLPVPPLLSVIRRPTAPDVIRPTFCPSSCHKLFGALPVEDDSSLLNLQGDEVDKEPATAIAQKRIESTSKKSSSDEEDASSCLCICPETRPVYIHALGHCAAGFEECDSVLRTVFDNSTVPVISELEKGEDVFIEDQLVWNKQYADSSVLHASTCSISSILVDSPLHRWPVTIPANSFRLALSGGDGVALLFEGSSKEQAELKGAVAHMKISCISEAAHSSKQSMHCFAVRIAGEAATPLSSFASPPSSTSRLTIIALSIVAFVLLIALLIVAALYHVCWNIQKRRLIADIQLQLMYQSKGAPGGMPQRHGGAPHPILAAMGGGRQPTPEELLRSPPQHVLQKRRLYFSAEFFEPEWMANPPAMAEQFLTDIRRMIDMAKDRIKAKRFHPRMNPIVEHPSEDKLAIGIKTSLPTVPASPTGECPKDSPRSEKSADSGRGGSDASSCSPSSSSDESNTSSKSSEEEEEEERKSSTEERKEKPGSRRSSIPISAVKIPKEPPPLPPRPTHSTMIPRLGQASPRIVPRTAVSEKGHHRTTPLTAPGHRSLDDLLPPSSVPPSLPTLTPPHTESPIPVSMGPSQRRHERRKGYAVFPSDPMLNKSLPRRPRRIPLINSS